jgi:hypothetical protein
MAGREEPSERLVHLARRLAEQTRAGRITWTRGTSGLRYVYAGTTGAVTLEAEPDLGRTKIMMRVRDTSGATVDELGTLPVAMTGLVGRPADAALADLYNAVLETSRAVVDGLIAEIG